MPNGGSGSRRTFYPYALRRKRSDTRYRQLTEIKKRLARRPDDSSPRHEVPGRTTASWCESAGTMSGNIVRRQRLGCRQLPSQCAERSLEERLWRSRALPPWVPILSLTIVLSFIAPGSGVVGALLGIPVAVAGIAIGYYAWRRTGPHPLPAVTMPRSAP